MALLNLLIFWPAVLPPMGHFMSEGDKQHLHVSSCRPCMLSKWFTTSSFLSGYRLPEVLHAVSGPHRDRGGLRQWQRAGGLLQQHRLPGPLCQQALQVPAPSHTLSVLYGYCSINANKQSLCLIFWKRASAAEWGWKVWARNAYLVWHPASSCTHERTSH